MKRRIISLFVVFVLILALLTGCSNPSKPEETGKSDYHDYINTDSAFPIIKKEAEPIKLKVVIAVANESRDWDELWVSRYLKDKYNIELEVELIRGGDARKEKKNLILNSGELPDMMWNMKLSTSEIVKYGMEDGLFLSLEKYINPELTPGLYEYWTDDVRRACTTPDGHVYTLPELTDPITIWPVTDGRMFIDTGALESIGASIPRNLNEFIDAMYQLKENDPNGVGSENYYPMGAGVANPFTSVFWYILNAYGYNTVDNFGLAPCLRDGKVVIPAFDSETYKEFLSLMNKLYRDGIINPDVFTIDSTGINAMMNNGNTALYPNAPYVSGITEWEKWESCYPLTSDWQSEPEAISPSNVSVGGFVVSASTKYPELCMRIADIFFNNKTDCCAAMWGGTGEGTEYDYDGFVLSEWQKDLNSWGIDESKLPEGYSSWSYMIEYLHGAMPAFGACDLEESRVKLCNSLGGEMSIEFVPDNSTSDGKFVTSTYYNMAPYAVETYPTLYYVNEQDAQTIMDLETVIVPYAKEQIANFIIGRRDLAEFSTFQEELKEMGMDRLLAIYTDIYNSYKQ